MAFTTGLGMGSRSWRIPPGEEEVVVVLGEGMAIATTRRRSPEIEPHPEEPRGLRSCPDGGVSVLGGKGGSGGGDVWRWGSGGGGGRDGSSWGHGAAIDDWRCRT